MMMGQTTDSSEQGLISRIDLGIDSIAQLHLRRFVLPPLCANNFMIFLSES